MSKINTAKLSGVRKFMTGESRYCQNCGKESYDLFKIVQDGNIKNVLQYCKACYDRR